MITGRNVDLLDLEQRHYDLLYRWACDGEIAWQWLGRAPSPEAFLETLWQNVSCQFVVSDKHGTLMGLVAMYGANFHHQHCYIRMGLAQRFRQKGWTMEAASLMIDHVFTSFNVRKIYGDASSTSIKAFDLSGQRRAHIEGVLTGHLFNGGDFEDAYIISIGREEWES